MRILITGGAGFVGSRLATNFRNKHSAAQIVVMDNLKRRGSEFNLSNLRKQNIEFVHGDIRMPSDFSQLKGEFDVFIEASAEPSVQAGLQESPRYLIDTNLNGTINSLEFAKNHAGFFVFLSTSRVYSLKDLLAIKLSESDMRYEIASGQNQVGLSENGLSEEFSVSTARSLYGASKLASELFVQEYSNAYNLKSVINRCGVIAGAGQFGKTDQGVFTLWLAHHYFNKPLSYTGFGGAGKQVRDLLHPADLFDLLEKQIGQSPELRADIFNVGGGRKISTSLKELTAICSELTENKISIASEKETSPVDIPLFITDSKKAMSRFGWEPKKSVQDIMIEIHSWLKENKEPLSHIF